MSIDPRIVEQARNTEIIGFLKRHRGFTFARSGSTYRCDQHPSLAVDNDRLSWYWHSKSIGGFGCIDFLMKAENMPFRTAVETVAPITGTPAATMQTPSPSLTPRPAQKQPKQKKPKKLNLPDKSGAPLRLYDYLCRKRGIDGAIVNALIREGKLYQDKNGNAVFVAFDENNTPRSASIRGTNDEYDLRFECYRSDKRYGFNTTYSDSDQIYIYESAIDLMSHGSIENIIKGDKEAWKRRNRLSLAGLSDIPIPKYLETHPKTKELVFCLDNDPHGRSASTSLSKKYDEKGYYVRIELSFGKDYNDDLTSLKNQIQQEKAHPHRTKTKNGIDL